MLSREQKRANLLEKLQLLRSVTHSRALNKASIIVDASKYIEELKQKVERLNREITCAQSSAQESSLPVVTVEALQNGFLINVLLEKSCPGLLVCVLDAFEDLGLNVLEARASCTDTFRLEALGEDHQFENVDAQMVKQAVLRAINNCASTSDQQER